MSRLQRTRRSCRQRDGKAKLRDRLQVFQFCVQTSCKHMRIGAGLQKKKLHSEWRFLVLFLFLIGSTTSLYEPRSESDRCILFEPLHYVAKVIGCGMGHTVALKSLYPYQITPPVSEGYLLLSVCTGESTWRCVGVLSPEILDVESVPSPEGCGEGTHVQSSGGHCRDGSGSEHGVECSTERPS